ncbi:hypothetical protein [Ferruginibacter sp. HRS2-29]|uniref:hypothetical protein n=1 Tax=Ferruginibacter sp. HRS2-29 TaxID=2487334 RepID=UPI0020CF124B|nr:hypothetical protein [Ferruginibacter sp. HRS2-29]MCP9751113.1 hypothetical protein [Ferruginibacter sp. HRS2-29]
MKKNFLAVALILMIGIGSATAQSNIGSHDYRTALGVKFYPGAVSIKHFVTDKNAIEGIGYFWNRGTRITGLYEIHGDINGAPGLKWYIGPGAHVGFYNTKYGGGSSVGVDGVLGLDYKIREAPINLSLDWQPSFEFGNNYGNGFNGNWGGLAIRYVF